MEASETQAQEPQEKVEPAVQPEPPTQQTDEGPDLREAVASIQDAVKRMEARQEEPQQPEGSLADLLYDFDPDEGQPQQAEYPEQVDPAQYQQQQSQQPDPYMQRIAAMEEHLIAREEQQRLAQIDALEDKYPDIKEKLPEIGKAIEQIELQAGQELPLTAGLLETAYKAVRADAASAQETPAEEANKGGASLETDAGAGAETREETEEEKIKRAIREAKPPDSVFTRG